MKAVAFVLVCVQIVASMPMLSAIDIRNRNEWFVSKYENERFLIVLQILPDPFVQRITDITSDLITETFLAQTLEKASEAAAAELADIIGEGEGE